MDQDNKSRPIYQNLELDGSGKRHLILTDQPLFLKGVFVGAYSGAAIWCVGVPAGDEGRVYPTHAALLQDLQAELATARQGIRLYAAGTEAFIWDVAHCAAAAGLGEGEVQLCQAGSLRRRVYCAHCKAITEDVTQTLFACAECHRTLFVRDHFSRRLRAFMGVQTDAEIPGDIPPNEALYL